MKAETENIRKRYEKQISDAKDFSISNFARDLLSVSDNINRALEHLPENIDSPEIKNIIIGVEMTKKELENLLSKYEVQEILPKIGDIFDHNLHNAISQIGSDEFDPGSIFSVLQSGYIMKGRLLRAATVTVSKATDK